jgi:MFS transporter, DHA1 family, multidrug resistance protein
VSWRRNQFAVTAAAFMGFTGFTLVMPFLPLYIKQLGVDDVGEIALWSGLSLGVTPAVTAVLSPFWGRVADRFGRKLMVQRSLFSFVLVMATMAYVTQAWHLFALRALQGLFAGYGGLTMAMAAESAPRERLARALGLVQTAQRIGPALGPVIGGAVAGLVGLRETFFVTSGFYVVALVLVTVLYRDPAHLPEAQAGGAASGLPEWRTLLRTPGFALMMAAIAVLTFVDRSFGPILPLWIGQHGVAIGRVAVTSGVLFSAAALGAAVGNHLCDGLLIRYAPGTVMALSTASALMTLFLFVLVREPWALALVLSVFGVATGLATTAAYTRGGRDVPAAAHGTGYGLLNAGALAGLAVGPVVAGLLAKASLLWVFGIDVALLALLAIVLGCRPGRAPRDPMEALP